MVTAVIGIWYSVNAWHQHKVHPKRFGVGLETWIGYSPIYVALEKDFFGQEGLDVNVMLLDAVRARTAAYEAGELDFFPSAPFEFSKLFSALEPKGKFVAALDESIGTEGVVSRATIDSIGALKGMRVGVQKGTASHFLLLYLLRRAGLSGKDIIYEELSADKAGQAFLSGSLDAAATGEPSLSEASQMPTYRVLAKSDTIPGLIVDVLLVSDRALGDNGRPLKAFMQAWYRGVGFIERNAAETETIVARALGLTTDDVHKRLAKMHFYSQGESTQYMRITLPCVMRDANDLYFEDGVITKKADLLTMIDYTLLAPQ
jgi:NitT/TauT family transport system substrate-binding protein